MSAATPVRLLGLPLELYRRAAVQRESILREFSLLELRPDSAELPARVREVMQRVERAYNDVTHAVTAQRDEAIALGHGTIDVTLHLPTDAGAAARELDELLDEVDAYCASEQYLLTPAPAPDVAAFRHWYFAEIAGQLAGQPATPWAASQTVRNGAG